MYSEPNESDADVTEGTAGNLTWSLDDETGVLTISGTGDMADYADVADRPWHANITSIKTVVIEQGVTSVGKPAFAYCTNLKTVTISGNITSIGTSAFQNCKKLTSVEILGNKLTSVSDSAFQSCSDLTSIVIPDNVASVEANAFLGCTSLKSVTVTGGLDSEGKITAGGIIDTYFKDGAAANWKLTGMTDAVKSLTLRDVVSLDYGPENIAADEGRELSYKDAEYTYSSLHEWGIISCSVLGTAKDAKGSPIADVSVILESESDGAYSAVTGADGSYIIKNLTTSTSGNITASKSGYQTGDPAPVSPTDGSVRMDLILTASAGSAEYYVTFGSGSYYTVYANGSPVSSSSPSFGVTGEGTLVFSIRTSEGYSASPIVSGIANLSVQADGSYLLRNIYSNVKVSVTVSPYSISDPDGPGNNGSGNGPDASPGNSNDSTGDSDEGIPLWIPVILAGAFAGCIAVAAIGHTVLVRRKN